VEAAVLILFSQLDKRQHAPAAYQTFIYITKSVILAVLIALLELLPPLTQLMRLAALL
jgi:hypothetical protein